MLNNLLRKQAEVKMQNSQRNLSFFNAGEKHSLIKIHGRIKMIIFMMKSTKSKIATMHVITITAFLCTFSV